MFKLAIHKSFISWADMAGLSLKWALLSKSGKSVFFQFRTWLNWVTNEFKSKFRILVLKSKYKNRVFWDWFVSSVLECRPWENKFSFLSLFRFHRTPKKWFVGFPRNGWLSFEIVEFSLRRDRGNPWEEWNNCSSRRKK